jgi:hypothetical protein
MWAVALLFSFSGTSIESSNSKRVLGFSFFAAQRAHAVLGLWRTSFLKPLGLRLILAGWNRVDQKEKGKKSALPQLSYRFYLGLCLRISKHVRALQREKQSY